MTEQQCHTQREQLKAQRRVLPLWVFQAQWRQLIQEERRLLQQHQKSSPRRQGSQGSDQI